MNTVTDRIRLQKCTMENTLYGLVAHTTMMIQQLMGDGNISDDVLDRMNIGWEVYVQAYHEYSRERNPPPPPLPPPRRRPREPAGAE